MKSLLYFQLLIFGTAFCLTSVCERALAQNPVSSIRLLGSNSPAGDSYNDLVTFDGGGQLIADGTLFASAQIVDLDPREYFVEARYSSVSGQFAEDPSNNWFANFRLTFDLPTENSGTYFWYEDENGPIDLSFNGWGGEIEAHPFDPDIPEVASFNSTRSPALEHQFGVFSNPFTFLTNELGVDGATVTGFGLGARLATAVPEPSTGILLLAAAMPLALRRRRPGCAQG